MGRLKHEKISSRYKCAAFRPVSADGNHNVRAEGKADPERMVEWKGSGSVPAVVSNKIYSYKCI